MCQVLAYSLVQVTIIKWQATSTAKENTRLKKEQVFLTLKITGPTSCNISKHATLVFTFQKKKEDFSFALVYKNDGKINLTDELGT